MIDSIEIEQENYFSLGLLETQVQDQEGEKSPNNM